MTKRGVLHADARCRTNGRVQPDMWSQQCAAWERRVLVPASQDRSPWERWCSVHAWLIANCLDVRHIQGWSRCPRNSFHHSATGHRQAIHWAVGPPDGEMWCARPDQKYECHALPYLLNGNGERSRKTRNFNDLITSQGHEFCCRGQCLSCHIRRSLFVALAQSPCDQAREVIHRDARASIRIKRGVREPGKNRFRPTTELKIRQLAPVDIFKSDEDRSDLFLGVPGHHTERLFCIQTTTKLDRKSTRLNSSHP